jgi:hypothetical protein
MSRSSLAGKANGFTLVEMLVVAPIALLVISGFIAVMIRMVGDVMVSGGRNGLTHDIQGSLDMIEQDVRLSTEFLTTTGTMPSPQGKDGVTSAFTSTGGDLVLGEIATDKNVLDPTRKFVYYNTPYGCVDPAQQYKNRIFFTTVMYFVRNGSLWRRTFVPTPSGTLCDTPWQVNTCAPGYPSTATQCRTNDTEVMKNVNSFAVTYYASSSSVTPLAASSASSATTINVQINGQQNVAGRTLAATASVRTTKLSDKDITLAPPGIPAVTAQAYSAAEPGTARFTWTANPLVTYSVRYNINGGAWITAAESTNDSSIKVTASRADTITVQVAARNTTGSSGYGAGASRTLPSWETCSLQNNWTNYGSPHATCGFTKTTAGVVVLKGLIRTADSLTVAATSGQVLFNLPPGYRPIHRTMFYVSTYDTTNTSGVKGRITIETDGDVTITNGNTGWVSLSDIKFIPTGSLYDWTPVTYQPNWADYGSSGYPPFEVTRDSIGRVHMNGLARTSLTTGSTSITQIATLPAGYIPSEYLHLPSYSNSTSGDSKRLDPAGGVLVNGYGNVSYHTMEAMYYPSAFSSWTNMTLQNSWVTFQATPLYYAQPQYTRAADCIVTLKGMIKSGATAAGTTVATLPVGYRPTETLIFGGVTSDAYYRVQVEATGGVRVTYANATWAALNNISFLAGDGSCPS